MTHFEYVKYNMKPAAQQPAATVSTFDCVLVLVEVHHANW